MDCGHGPAAKWRSLLILLAVAVLVGSPSVALADGPSLESREYKLMLNPAKFTGPPQAIVKQLWNELTVVIEKHLGSGRHRDSLALRQERTVMFRDTKTCLLNSNGLSLRERVRLKDGRRQLTLKFRTPDIFLAAQSSIGADDDEIKFEEDIAPLVQRTISASGKESATFVRPPSMRSLFSRSATRRIKAEPALVSLADVVALYPGLDAALERGGVAGAALQTSLLSGERFRELVFSGAFVDFGKVEAEFDLTLWHVGDAAQPVIAEFSYKYEVKDGEVADEVSWRALVLFRAMQETLGGWTSPESETKTSLALPKSCQN